MKGAASKNFAEQSSASTAVWVQQVAVDTSGSTSADSAREPDHSGRITDYAFCLRRSSIAEGVEREELVVEKDFSIERARLAAL